MRKSIVHCTVWKAFLALGLIVALGGILASPAKAAAKASEIDAAVSAALKRFQTEVKGGSQLLKEAKGVLVFPKVTDAGLVVGGEFGRGALRVKNKSVDYYTLSAISVGLQAGGQQKSLIFLFRDQASLDRFRQSSGWDAGGDASVVAIKGGGDVTATLKTIQQPVVAFAFDQKGLMADLSLEGTKITRMKQVSE